MCGKLNSVWSVLNCIMLLICNISNIIIIYFKFNIQCIKIRAQWTYDDTIITVITHAWTEVANNTKNNGDNLLRNTKKI